MKKIMFLLAILGTFQLQAQKIVSSTIQKVKVFRQNAEVNRQAQTALTPGQHEIVLSGISTGIDPSSLQIKFDNANSELLSAKYEPNYILEKSTNPKIIALQDIQENLNEEIAWLNDQKNALLGMEDILKKNQSLGGNQKGFTPTQVIELSNKYKTKYLEVRKERMALIKEEKKIKLQLSKTSKQLQEMQAQTNKPQGTIVLQLSSRTTHKLGIKCAYTVRNAGWTPLYDLRSEGITKDVKLNYRANVYQNTGQDWKNVELIVSTGNPTKNNNRPVLNPLYLNINNEYDKLAKKEREEGLLNMAQVEEKSDDKFLKDGYTSQAQISHNQINVEFTITNKQNVSSDGKKNLMALKTYSLPTKYIYHAVPKLCDGAFLLAKISDWTQFNLLPGKANIFFEGAFVGTSVINPNITSDTMLLSMGRDNGIVVKRNPIEKFTNTKMLRTGKKETQGYELVVKNKKAVPITIEILDQIPVTQNNQIKVDLDRSGDAALTKNIGKLLWTTTIQASSSWQDEFVYTIKYPKNNTVASLR